MWGLKTQRKANEALQQAKLANYTKRQTIHLLYFCGLKLNDRHILPGIWKTLQETKNWSDQMVEQTKWCKKDKNDEYVDVVFHKDLV